MTTKDYAEIAVYALAVVGALFLLALAIASIQEHYGVARHDANIAARKAEKLLAAERRERMRTEMRIQGGDKK